MERIFTDANEVTLEAHQTDLGALYVSQHSVILENDWHHIDTLLQ